MSDETRQDAPAPLGDEHWEALARYLAGESPAAEAEAVQRWLAEHGSEAGTLAALDAAMDRIRLAPAAGVDVEGALRSVKSRMAEAATRRREPEIRRLPRPMALRGSRSVRGPSVWQLGLLAAAAVIMFVIAGRLRTGAAPGTAQQPVAASRVFTTPVGQRDSVRLPDGTRVILGPGSRLALEEGFGSGARPVDLRGEAYFDVVHDALHPFSVHTGGVAISDVGTSFSVHGDSMGVRVSVTSGAVRMTESSGNTAVLLSAGDVGLASASGLTANRGAASSEDLAWTRGQLVFRNAELSDVATDLHRWYGVTLKVADTALEGRHVTASFAGDSARTVVRVIAMSLGADVQWRGDTAVLHMQGGARPRSR